MSMRSAKMREAFSDFGDTISELLKLAAILVFGSLLSLESSHRFLGLNTFLWG
jgi:hypothetical protein